MAVSLRRAVIVGLLVALVACKVREQAGAVGSAAELRPSLEPVIAVLRVEAVGLDAPGALDALRARFDVPPGPSISRSPEMETTVRRAIDDLNAALHRDPVLSEALGGTLDRAGALEILADADARALLRLDTLHDTLKVPVCLRHYPPPLLGTAVAHEFAHAADSAAMATELGRTREEMALLLDALDLRTGLAVQIALEQRAFRLELRAARLLGVSIAGPAPPGENDGSGPCEMSAERLRVTLRELDRLEGRPKAFDALVEAMLLKSRL